MPGPKVLTVMRVVVLPCWPKSADREPGRHSDVPVRRVGVAGVAVPSLAKSIPVWPCRVALAGRSVSRHSPFVAHGNHSVQPRRAPTWAGCLCAEYLWLRCRFRSEGDSL